MLQPKRVWFRETLTLGAYLRARLMNERTFYLSESLLVRIVRRVLQLPMGPLVEPLYFGNLQRSTGVRLRAYQHSLAQIARHVLPLASLNPGFDADMSLLASKFLLDRLYSRFEFQAMAAQFVLENPDIEACLVSDVDPFPGLFSSKPELPIHMRRQSGWLSFLLGLCIAPLYVSFLIAKNRATEDKPASQGDVLCEVDCMAIAEMFREIFTPEYSLNFYTQRHYRQQFSNDEAAKLRLCVHGVGGRKRLRLVRLLKNWLALAFQEWHVLARGGTIYFDFLNTLAWGILITPEAAGVTYLTFEHLSTVKAVRNELLRATGNFSVFVPFNAYAIDHFFAPEFRYNYDVLCSPCRLLEKVYQLQQATTRVTLPTGSYSPHRKTVQDNVAHERQARLAEFKGGSVAITILSAGILPGTLSSERQLVALAGRLASISNVKVFIRQKPVPLEARYTGFFDEVSANPNILLTHTEYKLFDFLPVTDVFVTSNSSSAVDLCGAGGDFFAVDFWHDRDLYLWQTEVEGVFLPADDAAGIIESWVRDEPPGTRDRHRDRMNALRGLIAYDAGDFNAYRRRMLDQLAPWLGVQRYVPVAGPTTERATT